MNCWPSGKYVHLLYIYWIWIYWCWIYLIHEFHNLSWITEINQLFHDILIYWDAPVSVCCVYLCIHTYMYNHDYLICSNLIWLIIFINGQISGKIHIFRIHLFEWLNNSLLLFSQAKEGKRLKEFLEDYDDDRDDPKYYRWALCTIETVVFFVWGRSEMHMTLRTNTNLVILLLKSSKLCLKHVDVTWMSCSSALPAGAALFRSGCGTERRRWSWMNVTGSGRRKSWRRSGRGC